MRWIGSSTYHFGSRAFAHNDDSTTEDDHLLAPPEWHASTYLETRPDPESSDYNVEQGGHVVQQRQAETAHVQVDAKREEAVPVEEDLTPATSFLLTTFSSTGAATVEEAPGGPSSAAQNEKKNDSIFTEDVISASSTRASPHETSTSRTITNVDGATSRSTRTSKKSNLRGSARQAQTAVTGTSRVAFLEDAATRPRTEQDEKMNKRDERERSRQEQEHVKNENQLVQPVENKKKFNLRGGAKKALSTGGGTTTTKIPGSQQEQEDFLDEDLDEDGLDHDQGLQGEDSVETGSEEDEQAEEAVERPGEELEEEEPEPPLHDNDDQSQEDNDAESTGESESDVAAQDVLLDAGRRAGTVAPGLRDQRSPPVVDDVGTRTSTTSTNKEDLSFAAGEDVDPGRGERTMHHQISGATATRDAATRGAAAQGGATPAKADPKNLPRRKKSNLRGAAGAAVDESRLVVLTNSTPSATVSSPTTPHEHDRSHGPGAGVFSVSTADVGPAFAGQGTTQKREVKVTSTTQMKGARNDRRKEIVVAPVEQDQEEEQQDENGSVGDEAQQPPEPSWTVNHFYLGEQHSTEAEASINDHPLLVFKQPLKKVHVISKKKKHCRSRVITTSSKVEVMVNIMLLVITTTNKVERARVLVFNRDYTTPPTQRRAGTTRGIAVLVLYRASGPRRAWLRAPARTT
ncbi:unnamed protein product [Amoebophrya sp. A120]|nr:unnamed protein product [Amoebophrya sp. A120]|eukprot:GSA120T00011055001.1